MINKKELNDVKIKPSEYFKNKEDFISFYKELRDMAFQINRTFEDEEDYKTISRHFWYLFNYFIKWQTPINKMIRVVKKIKKNDKK